MGYRDDFYVTQNIIGYTGTVHLDPTVYFLNGNEFGHITQNHTIKSNIGREVVGRHNQYYYANEVIDGQPHLVERIGGPNGQILHTSRNPLVTLAQMSRVQIIVLQQSVHNFTELKKFSTMSRDERKKAIYGEPLEGMDSVDVEDLIDEHEHRVALASK